MKHVQTFESFISESTYSPQEKADFSKLSSAAAQVAKLTNSFDIGAGAPQSSGNGPDGKPYGPEDEVWNGSGFSRWKDIEPKRKKENAEVLKKYNDGLKELGIEQENVVLSYGQNGYIGEVRAKKVFDLAKKLGLEYFTFEVQGSHKTTYIMFPAK
jgi:hypothetical protein